MHVCSGASSVGVIVGIRRRRNVRVVHDVESDVVEGACHREPCAFAPIWRSVIVLHHCGKAQAKSFREMEAVQVSS